jgi:site-specific DNA-methyltransferase (adenine-specific)
MIGPYEINSIVTGDALKLARALPNECIDLYLFSPPYNMGNSTGGGVKGARLGHYQDGDSIGRRGGRSRWRALAKEGALHSGYSHHNDNMPHDEYVAWQKSLLLEFWRTLKPTGAIYYNHKPRIFNGEVITPLSYNPDLPVRQIVIWARAGGINCTPAFYCSTHEWIVIFAKPDFRLRDTGASGVGDVWRFAQQSNTWHPAPFPLDLALRALETTKPGIVCDPFAGSGTVAVAAKKLGREYLCFELSPEYTKRAKQRVASTTLPLPFERMEQMAL